MIVSSYVIGVDNGVATFKASLVGIDEATQATPTLSLVNQTPFGPGQYSIEVPTATPVSDTDTFTFEVNDNADPQFRLRAVRTPAWIKYGEREVKLTLERDFLDRTELDAFKALTATSVTVKATKGAGESVAVKLAGGVRDEYTINGLTGQGDVERATVVWQGAYDAGTSKAYEIIVTTPTENIP
jgi:hypothetical protein